MFNQNLYHKKLATSWLGRSFYFFEELPSTNSYCKALPAKDNVHGALVLTDHQTCGRGQHKKIWETTRGENLTFSMVFKPDRKDGFILLTLACAFAVVEVLNETYGLDAVLKWPNDILIKGKKVCGILTETQFSGNNLDKIVIGIGLNVNQKTFSENIGDHATSLALEKGETICREALLAEILESIEHCFNEWEEYNPKLAPCVNRHLIGFGKWTRLSVNGKVAAGKHKFLGIDGAGKLLTIDENLDLNTFSYEQVRVLL